MKNNKIVYIALLFLTAGAGISLWDWGIIQNQISQSTVMAVSSLEEDTDLGDIEIVAKEASKTGMEPDVRVVSTEKYTLGEYTIEDFFGGEEIESGCYYCHDEEVTKSFHVPEKIIKIEARKGTRRRICPDCHGLEGADPERQMTDLRDIQFDVNAGENGLFKLEEGIPHAIHKRILVSGFMECIACHLRDPDDYTTFKMLIPKADLEDGQVLLCQNCKFHPERGNYIAVHIEMAEKTCTTCHTGDLLEIHRTATSKLGAP